MTGQRREGGAGGLRVGAGREAEVDERGRREDESHDGPESQARRNRK